MKTRKLWGGLGFLFLSLLSFATPACAADLAEAGGPPWETDLYLNIWGIGLGAEYRGLALREGVETRLKLSLCATYEDWGFYRHPDTSRYDPPSSGGDLGQYKRVDYVWSLGVRQGVLADPADGGNLVELFLFYQGLSDHNLPGGSPAGSLVFASGLPDRGGILQHSFVVGAAYDTIAENPERWTSKGCHAEVSCEAAPGGLNGIADFQRLNVTLKWFRPLIDSDDFCLLLADRLICDRLTGDYVPIGARTTFGGLARFPGRQVPGMGDGLRGLQVGRFDGYLKILNNFEVRATFPDLLGERITLGLVAYCDLGASDLCTGAVDWSALYAAVGVAAGLHTRSGWNLLAWANYFLAEERLTASFALGMHF